MDGRTFDAWLRSLTESRRSLLGGLLVAAAGWNVVAHAADAKHKGKGKKHKKKHQQETCGHTACAAGQHCCDDQRGLCCSGGAECCNPGAGTGSCCAEPNRCGQPWGNDAAPSECCPPERQWFTSTGLVRCCPAGTRSLGTGISSDDGPCCPEQKYCSQAPTGGTCCGDLAPVCVDRSTGQCCTEAATCGTDCCGFGEVCCNGTCCTFGKICDGGTCKCPAGVRECAGTCCPPTAVGCDGSRCLNQCDLDHNCGG